VYSAFFGLSCPHTFLNPSSAVDVPEALNAVLVKAVASPAPGRKTWRVTSNVTGSTSPPFTARCPRAEVDMVMFRASFGSEMMPFLSKHFRRSTYIWKGNYDADLFKAMIEKEKPTDRHR
jgi:hypothetical protein